MSEQAMRTLAHGRATIRGLECGARSNVWVEREVRSIHRGPRSDGWSVTFADTGAGMWYPDGNISIVAWGGES